MPRRAKLAVENVELVATPATPDQPTHEPEAKETTKMAKRVRMHNLDGGYYTLNGSITTGEGKTFKYSLPPGVAVEVEEIVYDALKRKFGAPKASIVPAALPNPDRSYSVPPDKKRVDHRRQYLIEFLND